MDWGCSADVLAVEGFAVPGTSGTSWCWLPGPGGAFSMEAVYVESEELVSRCFLFSARDLTVVRLWSRVVSGDM